MIVRRTIDKDELKELVEIAKVQSTEASNKIEGISTADDRLKNLVQAKTTPRNRDESETGRLFRFERKHALSTALAFGTEGKGHGRASAFSQGTQPEILCGHRERQGSIADLSTGLGTALQAGRKNF